MRMPRYRGPVHFLPLASVFALAACGASTPPATPGAPPPPAPPVAAAVPLPTPAASGGPPVAPVRPVTDTYFGTQVVDPYRWMEDLKSPEVQTWMKAQADYARAAFDALPERAALFARIKELDHSGDRVRGAQTWGGRWFYFKREQGRELAKYWVREGVSGAERVLVDPEALQHGDTHYAVDWAVPSPDGKLVAYGVSESGSESSVLHVVDVANGKLLPDSWDRMQFGGVGWIDAKHFFYSRLQKLGPDAAPTDRYKRVRAYEHELGRDPDKDPVLFGAGVIDAIPVTDDQFPTLFRTLQSKWIFAVRADGVRNEQTVYVAPLAALSGAKTPWKKVVDVADDVTGFDVRGDDVYLLTHKDALRSKIVKTSLAKPDFAHAAVVVPEGDVVLKGLGVAKDALYLSVLDAGIWRLRKMGFGSGAKVEAVALPSEGTIAELFTRVDLEGAAFGLTGWTVPYRVYAYDAKAKAFADTKLAPPPPVDFSEVSSEEVKVKSADGTMVPMSIVRAKTFAKDGSHPTWLSGYGAYGVTTDPYFSPTRLAWIERQGMFAHCHVRGGGELGEGWHKGGMLLAKQHTIDDMIACGQWLVDNHYTTTTRLAGEGTSAGGITIGGAITQRPDLFAAAIIRVGDSNMLRAEEMPAGPANVPEFGSVATEDGFRGLYAMDAYAHVKNGEKYPATVLTTGVTDPRVAPWIAAKMTARLQAATASGKPVLLRVDYDAGHGLGSTAVQRDAEFADEWAFLLSQFALAVARRD